MELNECHTRQKCGKPHPIEYNTCSSDKQKDYKVRFTSSAGGWIGNLTFCNKNHNRSSAKALLRVILIALLKFLLLLVCFLDRKITSCWKNKLWNEIEEDLEGSDRRSIQHIFQVYIFQVKCIKVGYHKAYSSLELVGTNQEKSVFMHSLFVLCVENIWFRQ